MPLKVDRLVAGSVETDSLNINGGSLGLPYKVYTAKLTQTGTSNPTAVVLDNTLGGELVWTRQSKGTYRGTLIGAFSDSSKILFPYFFNGSKDIVSVSITNDDIITIATGAPTDDVLDDTPIEIRVYS